MRIRVEYTVDLPLEDLKAIYPSPLYGGTATDMREAVKNHAFAAYWREWELRLDEASELATKENCDDA